MTGEELSSSDTTDGKITVVLGSPTAVMALNLFLVEKFRAHCVKPHRSLFFTHNTANPPSAALRRTARYVKICSSAQLQTLFLATVNTNNVSGSAEAQAPLQCCRRKVGW